jgi:predicted molibdopterin-dependent oxidoreductase YjgC
MDEIAQISSIYAGVSYQRLEDESVTVMRTGLETPKPTQLLYTSKEYRGIQWPCVSKGGPAIPVLYADGFPGGKASPVTPEFQIPDNRPAPEYSAWFVPGRVLLQSEREMRVEGDGLNRIVRDELVEINPSDGDDWSIAEGDAVEIETPARRLAGLVKFSESMPPGTVAVTTLFGQLAVDLQASEEMDPMSKVPALDIVPARIAKVQLQ